MWGFQRRTSNPDQQMLLDAILHEYTALRREITSLSDRQYVVIYWGMSLMALVLAAVITAWDKIRGAPALLLFIFFVVVPGLGAALATSWAFLIVNIAAMGTYIHAIEAKVAVLFPSTPLRSLFQSPIGNSPDKSVHLMLARVIGWEHSQWDASNSHDILYAVCRAFRRSVLTVDLVCLAAAVCVVIRYVPVLANSLFPSINAELIYALGAMCAAAIWLAWLLLWHLLSAWTFAAVQSMESCCRSIIEIEEQSSR